MAILTPSDSGTCKWRKSLWSYPGQHIRFISVKAG